jgi:hypothetical protein
MVQAIGDEQSANVAKHTGANSRNLIRQYSILYAWPGLVKAVPSLFSMRSPPLALHVRTCTVGFQESRWETICGLSLTVRFRYDTFFLAPVSQRDRDVEAHRDALQRERGPEFLFMPFCRWSV